MMMHVLTNEDFAALGAPSLVYVRPIKAADVITSAPQGAFQAAFGPARLRPEQILYAVHGADGARLAVLADRDTAYAAALAHELAPVSVH